MFDFLKNILGMNQGSQQEFGSFDNRVTWEPAPPQPGDSVHITYQGLLKNSGAGDVYLHYSFDSWSKGIATVKMHKSQDGSFDSDIPFNGNQEINFCFKDDANNWDNNNGHNWTVHPQ
jgi:hypothetical protein